MIEQWLNNKILVYNIFILRLTVCRQQRIYRAFDLSAKKKGLYVHEDPYAQVRIHMMHFNTINN